MTANSINVKYTISADSLTKKFKRNILFRNLSISLNTGKSLSIIGPNGSGKSTLLKILAGLQNPTNGTVEYTCNNEVISLHDMTAHIGYSGPLINPYDELTGLENILFAYRSKRDDAKVDSLLEKFNLIKHKDQKTRVYSSGMKQRLKFILAVINDPSVLILDEPGTNLDAIGKEIVFSFLDTIRSQKIIILATNDMEEARFCKEEIRLGA